MRTRSLAAHRELQGAAEQVIEGSKPTHGTLLFMAKCADNLDQLSDTVQMKS